MKERADDEVAIVGREADCIAPSAECADVPRCAKRLLARRLGDGERLIGKKIGVTSKVVQVALGVHQPDFGYLTDVMSFDDGSDLPVRTKLIAPRAEVEIAFVLERDLKGPGVSARDVLAATAFVKPCFEIVDSRIADWEIKIQDTIADNCVVGNVRAGSYARVAARGRLRDVAQVGGAWCAHGGSDACRDRAVLRARADLHAQLIAQEPNVNMVTCGGQATIPMVTTT